MELTWDGFSERLTRVLVTLEERTFCIIEAADGSNRYVQYAVQPDRLLAEATGSRFLPPALAETAPTRLGELGWTPTPDNWTTTLQLPGLTSELAHLATTTVATLRDAFAIASPDQLSYRAWRDADRMLPGRTYSQAEIDALDPGQDPLPLDLGIPASLSGCRLRRAGRPARASAARAG